MPLPLLAVPLAMGATAAAGAIAQNSAARQQAKAMMPAGYKRRLSDLEGRERRGALGLTDAERMQMESAGVSSRAGLVAQQQAQQLQRASAASGAALSGRDLFAQEMGMQETLASQVTQEDAAIEQANQQAAEAQRQQLMELQQRQADSEAARKMANRQLIADLATTAGTAVAGIYGSAQMAKGYDKMIGAASGSTRMRDAQADMYRGQMSMKLAGAFGGGSPNVPGMQPPGRQMPATGGPAANPRIIGYDAFGQPIYGG